MIIILGVTKVPTCRLWTWAKMQVVRNDQIYNFFFMKNMFKGMYAPRLSHINVEKTMFSDKTSSNTTGPMLAKGNNKLSVVFFYANP